MISETVYKLIEAILLAFISVAVPILTAYFVQWLKAKMEHVKGQLSAEQYQTMKFMIDGLVMAAEQYNVIDTLKMTGAEKKAWVIEEAEKLFEKNNLPFDAETILNLIETSVYNAITQPEKFLPNVPDEPVS